MKNTFDKEKIEKALILLNTLMAISMVRCNYHKPLHETLYSVNPSYFIYILYPYMLNV